MGDIIPISNRLNIIIVSNTTYREVMQIPHVTGKIFYPYPPLLHAVFDGFPVKVLFVVFCLLSSLIR